MKRILLGALAALLAAGCDDDGYTPPTHEQLHRWPAGPQEITAAQEASQFIYDAMSVYYYWNAVMPVLNPLRYSDPAQLFEDCLSTQDHFSYMTLDADKYREEETGVTTSCGLRFRLEWANESAQTVQLQVLEAIPGSPAARAGVMRGDVITAYAPDWQAPTLSDYPTTVGGGGTFQAKRNGQVVTYEFHPAVFTEDFVHVARLVSTPDGKKVAYIYYSSFGEVSNDRLTTVVDSLGNLGPDAVVIDVRDNRGGDELALQRFCSLLAPRVNVAAKDVLLKPTYNKTITALWPDQFGAGTSDLHFDADMADHTLDQQRVTFIANSGSYSAAEELIWSLRPYMQTTLVGERTGGKNSMMFVMQPSDFVDEQGQRLYSTAIDNVLIMPIVAICCDARGEAFDTSDGRGIPADYDVDEYSQDLLPFGDPNETLLHAALEVIDGREPATNSNKSAQRLPPQPAPERAPALIAHPVTK